MRLELLIKWMNGTGKFPPVIRTKDIRSNVPDRFPLRELREKAWVHACKTIPAAVRDPIFEEFELEFDNPNDDVLVQMQPWAGPRAEEVEAQEEAFDEALADGSDPFAPVPLPEEPEEEGPMHGPEMPPDYVRPYAGSTRPPNVGTFLWRIASAKEKAAAIEDYRLSLVQPAPEQPSSSSRAAPSQPAPAAAAAVTHGPSVLIEFCCDLESNLGIIAPAYNCVCIRLTKEQHDVLSPAGFAFAKAAAETHAGAHLWGAVPCTPWSSWQHLNLSKGSIELQLRIRQARKESLLLIDKFCLLAEIVLKQGGTVSYEWPRYCSGWLQKKVRDMIRKFNLSAIKIDGCSVGVTDAAGTRVKKPWLVVSSCPELEEGFAGNVCSRDHVHTPCQGQITARTAFYPPAMCHIIHRAFSKHDSAKAGTSVVAMPACQPQSCIQIEESSKSCSDVVHACCPSVFDTSMLVDDSDDDHDDEAPQQFATPQATPPKKGLNKLVSVFASALLAMSEAQSSVLAPASFGQQKPQDPPRPLPRVHQEHREKICDGSEDVTRWLGMVTRTIAAGSPEFRSDGCAAALHSELSRLRASVVWNESKVCEWSQVCANDPQAMVGRLFAIMGQKHSELAGKITAEGEPKAIQGQGRLRRKQCAGR